VAVLAPDPRQLAQREPRLEIRELTHSDRAAVEFALRHLGERSRYQRYLFSSGPPIRREAARLMTVDHWHHEVLIAFQTHPRIPIGVAEYVRTANFEEAEVAIAIADEWQHRGAGRALMAELRRRALGGGIRRINATALYDNHGALQLLRELGEATPRHGGGGVVELSVELAQACR
jgi:GNAT superfamily N-acetyltransferase